MWDADRILSNDILVSGRGKARSPPEFKLPIFLYLRRCSGIKDEGVKIAERVDNVQVNNSTASKKEDKEMMIRVIVITI